EGDGLLRNVARPDLCLDSRLGYAVRLTPCTDGDGVRARAMRYDFTVRGALIPRSDQGLALAPAATDGSGALVLKNRTDDDPQRWALDSAAPDLRMKAVTWDTEAATPPPPAPEPAPATATPSSPPAPAPSATASRPSPSVPACPDGATCTGARPDGRPGATGPSGRPTGQPLRPATGSAVVAPYRQLRPDGLAVARVPAAPALGELPDQQQPPADRDPRLGPAQVRRRVTGVGDLADQGGRVVDQPQPDGRRPVPDGVGDQFA